MYYIMTDYPKQLISHQNERVTYVVSSDGSCGVPPHQFDPHSNAPEEILALGSKCSSYTRSILLHNQIPD